MATQEERSFIEERQEGYREAHNSLDVATLMKWMSEDLDYSEHGMGVAHISKSGLHDLATAVFSSFKDLVFTTVSTSGTKAFTAWEWTARGIVTKEIPGVPFKEGDVFQSMGCSLFWWKEGAGDDGEGVIEKLAEYSRFVGV